MVCADFRTKQGSTLAHSCRSTMLHYRSQLMEIMHTIVFSPLLLFGRLEEKQQLHIELFADYQEDNVVSIINWIF